MVDSPSDLEQEGVEGVAIPNCTDITRSYTFNNNFIVHLGAV